MTWTDLVERIASTGFPWVSIVVIVKMLVKEQANVTQQLLIEQSKRFEDTQKKLDDLEGRHRVIAAGYRELASGGGK